MVLQVSRLFRVKKSTHYNPETSLAVWKEYWSFFLTSTVHDNNLQSVAACPSLHKCKTMVTMASVMGNAQTAQPSIDIIYTNIRKQCMSIQLYHSYILRPSNHHSWSGTVMESNKRCPSGNLTTYITNTVQQQRKSSNASLWIVCWNSLIVPTSCKSEQCSKTSLKAFLWREQMER